MGAMTKVASGESSAMGGETIQFRVPLPPSPLRSNSRAHWQTKMGAKQAYSRDVLTAWGHSHEPRPGCCDVEGAPWKAARVTYTWRYAGVAPDRQNLGANLKALTDILCCAPNTGKLATNHTTYLGLIEDDKGIDPEYRLEKVSRRAAEGVLVRIERREP